MSTCCAAIILFIYSSISDFFIQLFQGALQREICHMIITVFCNSKHISIRLMELIDETNEGVSYYSAFSYEEAIQRLTEQYADVVLIDVDFAKNKTPELLKRIQQNPGNPVVMVLFSAGSEISMKQFRNSGADYLFDKYNDFEKIAPVIKSITDRLVT